MSTLSQFGGSGIKSIQRGAISFSTSGGGGVSSSTATITAVDPAKSQIEYLGMTTAAIGSEGSARVELTNSTTVTAYCYQNGTSSAVVVGYQVTEYY